MLLVKRELSDSGAQLTSDFGEYPLHCFPNKEDRSDKFYIVRNSPFNRKLYDWLVILRALKSGELERAADAIRIKAAIQDSISDFKSAFVEPLTVIIATASGYFRSSIEAEDLLSRASYIFKTLMYALLLPVTIIFLFVLLMIMLPALAIFKIAPMLFRASLSTGARGIFTPVSYCGTPEIRLVNSFHKFKSGLSEDELISHEHVHLLQHAYSSEERKFARTRDTFRGESREKLKNHLEDPENKIDQLAYYFEINEMEARLHEVVLSFYRSNRSLPRSHQEYIQMLLAADSVIGRLTLTLLSDHNERSGQTAKPYTVRSDGAETEMFVAICEMKDDTTKRRFLLEALPVMYANLLLLYGYVEESSGFLKTVECTDMFAELYGASALPGSLRTASVIG